MKKTDSTPQLKGDLINHMKIFTKESFGPDAYDKILLEVKKTNPNTYPDVILNTDWVDEKLCMDMCDAVENVFGNGDYSVCKKMGKRLAELGMNTIYRVFISFMSPKFILKSANKIWKLQHTHGYTESEDTNDGKGHIIKYVDLAYPRKSMCYLLVGYMTEVVELVGLKNVQIKHTECRTDGFNKCVFVCSWDELF